MVPSGQTPSPCLAHSDAQKIQTDFGRIGDGSERKSERVCTGGFYKRSVTSTSTFDAQSHMSTSGAKWEEKFARVSKRSNFD